MGAAFTKLLGFRFLPRLKNAGSICLYRPDETFTRPIRWELFAEQYDQKVRYAALRLDMAEAESILRRSTRSGPKHPT